MIDRINNQKYYEYSKINKQKKETTESAEFHMDLGKQGVIYEKNEQKKAEKTETSFEEEKEQKASTQSNGVKLEISSQGYEKSEKEKTKASFLEGVKKYAAIAVDLLKNIWDKIWNEQTSAKETEFPEILEEQMAQKYGPEETGLALPEEATGFPDEVMSETITEPSGWRTSNQIAESIYTQEEIRQIFRRGNQKEIEDFLSNHGERHLARNTDLLTQYDRKGILVGINNSDKELILHGNKNEIKL